MNKYIVYYFCKEAIHYFLIDISELLNFCFNFRDIKRDQFYKIRCYIKLGFSKDLASIYASSFPLFLAPHLCIQRCRERRQALVVNRGDLKSFKGCPRAGGSNQLSPDTDALAAQRGWEKCSTVKGNHLRSRSSDFRPGQMKLYSLIKSAIEEKDSDLRS